MVAFGALIILCFLMRGECVDDGDDMKDPRAGLPHEVLIEIAVMMGYFAFVVAGFQFTARGLI